MARLIDSSSRYTMLGIDILNHPPLEFPKESVVYFAESKNGWKYKLQLSTKYLKWRKNQNKIRLQRNRSQNLINVERIRNNTKTLIMALFKYLSGV